MTGFIFNNFISTTLASAVTSSSTTMTLSSNAGLPTSIPAGYVEVFVLNDVATRLVFEIVYATAISGTTITVLRAQEGTSAAAWGTGSYLYSQVTAGQMAGLYSGRLLNTQTFKLSATYTPTPGTNAVEIEVQAGGGAAAGNPATTSGSTSCGSGGGSGAWAWTRITSGVTSTAVTVGLGGVGASGAAGGNGGTSSFGSIIQALGGSGGAPAGPSGTSTTFQAAGGLGGVLGTSGTLNAAGLQGGGVTLFNGTGLVLPLAAGRFVGGYGSGGIGGAQSGSAGATVGAAGQPGIIIVREYS